MIEMEGRQLDNLWSTSTSSNLWTSTGKKREVAGHYCGRAKPAKCTVNVW